MKLGKGANVSETLPAIIVFYFCLIETAFISRKATKWYIWNGTPVIHCSKAAFPKALSWLVYQTHSLPWDAKTLNTHTQYNCRNHAFLFLWVLASLPWDYPQRSFPTANLHYILLQRFAPTIHRRERKIRAGGEGLCGLCSSDLKSHMYHVMVEGQRWLSWHSGSLHAPHSIHFPLYLVRQHHMLWILLTHSISQ